MNQPGRRRLAVGSGHLNDREAVLRSTERFAQLRDAVERWIDTEDERPLEHRDGVTVAELGQERLAALRQLGELRVDQSERLGKLGGLRTVLLD